MSRLASLMDRAKGLFSRERPTRDATEAVKQDSFDRDLFESLLDEAPALREKLGELEQDVDFAGDVLRDTMMQFWKGDPQLRPRNEMAEKRLVQHAVATDVAQSDELADARRYTVHDQYGSAMATIGVSEKVHEYAREHKQELEEAQREKEEAEQREQEAREQAEQAAQAAQDSPFSDPDMHGPPSPEQQQAMDDLAAALESLAQAQSASDQASQQLDEQAHAMKAALARPVDQSVSETREQLQQEEELFAAWGVTDGELEKMDFEERAQLAAALRSNRLSKYAELIGRMKMMAAAQRVKRVEFGRDQVVGVELSDDLSRVTMSEIVNLAMGDDDLGELMELDFYRRLMEQQLLSREFEGHEKVGKGAIICCVDTSGSMKGEREAYSKALALALLDVARRQSRDFVGINFSSRNQVGVHRFPPLEKDITKVMAFGSEFFGGGTDFMVPLDRATDILEEEFNGRGKEKGDIVFITDDQCSVTPEWMEKYLQRKDRLSFRVFGIAAGMGSVGGTLNALSDNTRAIQEFVDPNEVRDIFQVI